MQKKKEEFSYRTNDDIRNYPSVRIVGDEIESKVCSMYEARKIADELEMDLIEINYKANPPIIRIANYGKFIYSLKKNAKKNKPQNKPLKEIQLRTNIASNDLKTKANNANKFLQDGSKVKVVLTMKGRELTRREENKKVIYEFITLLEDVGIPETMPKDEGNRTTVILKQKKQ